MKTENAQEKADLFAVKKVKLLKLLHMQVMVWKGNLGEGVR